MIVSKLKKKIIICAATIPTSLAVIAGVTVGGYFISHKANPFGSYAKAPINTTNEAYKAVYYSYLINNSNMLVLPGFSLKPSMVSALTESKFNEAAFLLVDDSYYGAEAYYTSQVAGVSFRSDRGSFVTGIAIASYLNEYKDYFKQNDGKLTWGTYGGMPFNSVISFMTGIQLGIAWFNDNIARQNGYEPVEQISIGSNEGDVFAGGFGPNDGDSLIDRFLQTDIDCLIPVAGPQIMSAANKIVAKNKRTILIGVDSAVENDNVLKTKKLPKANNMPKIEQIVTFSSLKNVGYATYQILNNIKAGRSYEQATNNIGGLGYQSLGTVENGCVSVSEPGQQYFVKAMKTKFPNLTNYNDAISKLPSIPEYNNLNKGQSNENSGYRKFIPFGSPNNPKKVTVNDFVHAPLPSWGEYLPLPEQGEPYEKMPDKVPKSEEKYFSQADWDFKKDAPNRFQSILNSNKNPYFPKAIREVLSTPTSVLLDASFSQSCYDGIAAFYSANNVKIPFTNSTQSLIDLINNQNVLIDLTKEIILTTRGAKDE